MWVGDSIVEMLIWIMLMVSCRLCSFFFFQAEDGIRDDLVTGVQTCALPISSVSHTNKISLMKSPSLITPVI